jgi:pimeloyl-ACP methyl ester carboxylesterase
MALDVTLRDLAARGARIRFAIVGEGAPLVLVHDVLACRSMWDEVLPALGARSKVIAPDLPGFGDSEKPQPSKYAYGPETFAESLVDLIASLDLGRVSLCGHGLGASIALTLAARHASLVDRVVLVSPAVFAPPRTALVRVGGLPVVGPLLFKQLAGRTLFRRHFGVAAPGARVAELYESFNTPAAREAAHATLAQMRDPRPVAARLGAVRAPVLVVGGREDRAFAISGRKLAKELSARYEVLECGPSPAEEVPDDFVRVVTTFLHEDTTQKRRAGRGGRAA